MKRLDHPLTYILSAIALAIIATVLLAHLAEPPNVQAASQFATVVCDGSVPFSSASSVQVITAGGTNQFLYICNFAAGSIGGSTFSIVEGTGSTCGTNTAALAGGTTAAAGFGLAANGSPVQFGSGVGMVMKTKTAGDNVCLIIGGTGPLAGTLAWTSAPF